MVLTVRVALAASPADRLMNGGVRDSAGPEGDTPSVKAIIPVKPIRLVTVTVMFPDCPAIRDMLSGFAEMEKSGPVTTIGTVTVATSVPLPAVRVRL